LFKRGIEENVGIENDPHPALGSTSFVPASTLAQLLLLESRRISITSPRDARDAGSTGRAIAASYEAKRLGITTGTLVREAKQICPAVIPVQARHRLYTEYHKRMLAAVDTCVPGLS
jgi:nucleotidyltransferase/DNA polymerase involved in DNA repair